MKIPYNKKTKTYETYYTPRHDSHEDYTIKDNFEFSDKLVYIGFSRGRSALNIIWEDTKGRKYHSGMKLLDDTLQKPSENDKLTFVGLIIEGTFTFKKQGTSVLLLRING